MEIRPQLFEVTHRIDRFNYLLHAGKMRALVMRNNLGKLFTPTYLCHRAVNLIPANGR